MFFSIKVNDNGIALKICKNQEIIKLIIYALVFTEKYSFLKWAEPI